MQHYNFVCEENTSTKPFSNGKLSTTIKSLLAAGNTPMKNKTLIVLTIIFAVIVVYLIFFDSSPVERWSNSIAPPETVTTPNQPIKSQIPPSPSTRVPNPLPIESFYKQGQLSFLTANRINLQRQNRFLFQFDQVMSSFGDEQWADLYVNSLSQLEIASSHIFLHLLEKLCHKVAKIKLQLHSQEEQEPQAQFNNLSLSAQQNSFYLGYRTQEIQFRNQNITDCNTILDLAENNRSSIEESALNHYGTRNLEEFFMKFYDKNTAMESLSQTTGFNRNGIYSKNYAIESKIRFNEKNQHTDLVQEIIDKTQQDPALYLDNNFCGWSNFNCSQLMKKDAYFNFYRNGAFLGKRATLTKYISILEAQGDNISAIAWLKYHQDLNYYGCEGFNVIDNDLSLKHSIKTRLEHLDSEQVEQVDKLYQSLKKQYLAQARDIISC